MGTYAHPCKLTPASFGKWPSTHLCPPAYLGSHLRGPCVPGSWHRRLVLRCPRAPAGPWRAFLGTWHWESERLALPDCSPESIGCGLRSRRWHPVSPRCPGNQGWWLAWKREADPQMWWDRRQRRPWPHAGPWLPVAWVCPYSEFWSTCKFPFLNSSFTLSQLRFLSLLCTGILIKTTRRNSPGCP